MSSFSSIPTGVPNVDEYLRRLVAEYNRSRQKWTAFVNYSHGISVMAEEVLELIKDMNDGCPDMDNSRMEAVEAGAMIMAIFLELL